MIIAGLGAFAASDKIVPATHRQQTPMFHGHLEVADRGLLRTLGYIASTIALLHCHKRDKAFTDPQPDRSLLGNLLLMMRLTGPPQGREMPQQALDPVRGPRDDQLPPRRLHAHRSRLGRHSLRVRAWPTTPSGRSDPPKASRASSTASRSRRPGCSATGTAGTAAALIERGRCQPAAS